MVENLGISPVFLYNREARHTFLTDAESCYILFSMFPMIYNAINMAGVELPCLLAGGPVQRLYDCTSLWTSYSKLDRE